MTNKVYVVYQTDNGGFENVIVSIEGKVNSLTVEKAIQDNFYYRNSDYRRIISWQIEDEFTPEERKEFYEIKR